jgi:hypothetical protein
MGAAGSTVWYNLKLRHPTLDMPIIDYDLALLIQPMLMLGISIGVIFNVIFPDWLVTILLIVLFIGIISFVSLLFYFLLLCIWKRRVDIYWIRCVADVEPAMIFFCLYYF